MSEFYKVSTEGPPPAERAWGSDGRIPFTGLRQLSGEAARAMASSRDVAAAAGSRSIGVEHLAIALLEQRGSVLGRALGAKGLDARVGAEAVRSAFGIGAGGEPAAGEAAPPGPDPWLLASPRLAEARVVEDDVLCVTTVHLLVGATGWSDGLGETLAEAGLGDEVLMGALEELRDAHAGVADRPYIVPRNDPLNRLPGPNTVFFGLDANESGQLEALLSSLPQPITAKAFVAARWRDTPWRWDDLLAAHGCRPEDFDTADPDEEPGRCGLSLEIDEGGPILLLTGDEPGQFTLSAAAARAFWAGAGLAGRAGQRIVSEAIASACLAVRGSSARARLLAHGAPLGELLDPATAVLQGLVYHGAEDVLAVEPVILGSEPLVDLPVASAVAEVDAHVVRRRYVDAVQQALTDPADPEPRFGRSDREIRVGGLRRLRSLSCEIDDALSGQDLSRRLAADARLTARFGLAAAMLGGDATRMARQLHRLGCDAALALRRNDADMLLAKAERLAAADGELDLADAARRRRAELGATFEHPAAAGAAAEARMAFADVGTLADLVLLINDRPWLVSPACGALAEELAAGIDRRGALSDLDLATQRGELVHDLLGELHEDGLDVVHERLARSLGSAPAAELMLGDGAQQMAAEALDAVAEDLESAEALQDFLVRATVAAEHAIDSERAGRWMAMGAMLARHPLAQRDEALIDQAIRALRAALRAAAPGGEVHADAGQTLANVHRSRHLRTRNSADARAAEATLAEAIAGAPGPGPGVAAFAARLLELDLASGEGRPATIAWLSAVARFGHRRLWEGALPDAVADEKDELELSAVDDGLRSEDPYVVEVALDALDDLPQHTGTEVLRARLLMRLERTTGRHNPAAYAEAAAIARGVTRKIMQSAALMVVLTSARVWLEAADASEDPALVAEVDREVTSHIQELLAKASTDDARLEVARRGAAFADLLVEVYLARERHAEAVVAIESSRCQLLNHHLGAADRQRETDASAASARPVDDLRAALGAGGDVAAALDTVTADEPLVYLICNERTAAAYVVRGARDVELVALPGLRRSAVADLALDLKGAERSPAFSGALLSVGKSLWAGVMEPLAAAGLGALDRMRLVPGDLFQFVPLQVAWHPDADAADGRRFAGELWNLTFTPSARVLAFGRSRRTQLRVAHAIAVAPENSLTDLPFAPREVQEVLRAVPGTRVLQGPDATMPGLFNEMRKGHEILHFAGHGISQPVGREQYLMVSDGFAVGLGDLFQAARPGRLAVLSACNSAQPSLEHRDEALSIATGMLAAGYPTVVATSWEVSDLSSTILMARFYRLLAAAGDQVDIAGTLWEAQQWLRHATIGEAAGAFPWISMYVNTDDGAARPFGNPYHWAGPVLYGW